MYKYLHNRPVDCIIIRTMVFKNTISNEISLKAYAKINLGLDVTGVMDDGYHLVKMIMQTVGLYDIVTIRKEEGGKREITLSCTRPDLPCDESNIAWRAAAAIMDEYGIKENVSIYIEKNIPMAAGMAGGSTDGAAVIKGLNELFGLGLSLEEMDRIAVKIGADVPFCLRTGTYLSEGIGEVLTKLPDVPDADLLIVNPPISVSTAEVYRKLDDTEAPDHPDIDYMIRLLEENSIRPLAQKMGNILENVTIKDIGLISQIKEKMMELGAAGSMMTGSGPTVFGLFEDSDKAEDAYAYFSDRPELGNSFLTVFVR